MFTINFSFCNFYTKMHSILITQVIVKKKNTFVEIVLQTMSDKSNKSDMIHDS